jgi:hypothetical protein
MSGWSLHGSAEDNLRFSIRITLGPMKQSVSGDEFLLLANA